MPQRIMTRLKLEHMKELNEAHQLLKAVIESLDKTSWAGARTAKAALEPRPLDRRPVQPR
jgi:hypothetical protein